MNAMRHAAGLSLAALMPVACLPSCSPPSSAPEVAAAPDAGTFVALVSDFSGFRHWPSTPGVGPDGAPPPPTADGGVHAGPLTTYIDQKPPPGSTSFPVGTIIVKEQDEPPLADRQIFAMVKRGGGYNASGANGWEWFELANVDPNDVEILWRGIGPPSGQAYGGSIEVCNNCHALAHANDYVWTEGLKLSSP